MFVDIVKISAKAGNGGDGAVSFHREKYVAMGGPNGGDGGKGGDVIFRASRSENTLIKFKYKKKFNAQNGENGQGGNKTGASAEDLIIDVPEGTVVRDAATGKVILDLFEDGEMKVLMRGGRGGKGNARFATPTRQAPNFSTPGQRTEILEVQLELKTIADVGLIGMPNVGKSTLLSVLTAARPKIANYHFTTLSPNLGVVVQDDTSFVMADIPGLIEGASEGAGLGHKFLRHIERTRMLLHVVDASGSEGRDPLEDFHTINAELKNYSEILARLPQIVIANKMDITGSQEGYEKLKLELEPKNIEVYPVSSFDKNSLQPVLRAVVKMLAELPHIKRYEVEYEFEPSDPNHFEVEKYDDAYIVQGPYVDNLLLKTNADDESSMRYFQQALVKSGIIDALRKAGAEQGDTVVMGEWEFDFVD